MTVEPDDTVTAPETRLGGPDIFLSARTGRRVQMPRVQMPRVLLPRVLRRGRSRANDARRAAARANHPCQSGGLHLVDLDGATETARIALRRRFEEPATPATQATQATPAAGESAAG
jgi:hypothetical protein